MDFIYYPFIFFMKHKFGGLTYLHYLCSTSKYTAYTMKLIKGEFKEKLELQFAPSIKAGFPSPAEDTSVKVLISIATSSSIPRLPSMLRWMAIQENGTDSLDYFAMLKGWGLAREGT